MADEFRGLTLRLGADARPVRTAIDSIKRSAGEAQKQLNAMNKALKFDGDNARALSSAIDLAGDKAKLAADAALKIRTAMSQAGGEVRKLASETDKAYSRTQKLRSEYNSVDAQLQRVYDSMKRTYAAQNNMSEQAPEVTKHINTLKNAYGGASDKAKELTAEMNKLLAVSANRKGFMSKFGLEKGDVDGLKDALVRLRAEHKNLNAELSKANDVQGYRALKTQLVSWEAEIRKAASEATDFNAKLASLGKNGDLVKLRSEMKRIEQGLEEASAAASKADSSFKKMPNSIQAARVKAIAFASKADSIDDAIANIDKQLDKIRKNPAFDKQAAATGNVYKALSKAKSEADSYRTKLTKLESALDHLQEEMRVLDERGMDHSEKEFEQVEDKIKRCTAAIDEYRAHVMKADSAVESAQLGVDYRTGVLRKNELVGQQAEMSPSAIKLDQWRSRFGELRTMGYGLYSTITPVFAMMGRSAVQSAETVDSAFRNMRKTVNVTGVSIEEENAKFEQLKQSMIDYSLEHVTSADELLNIAAIGGQLGVPIDELEEYTKVVSDLSIATDEAFGTEDVALWLGKMQNILSISDDELRSFADALVRLGNNEPALESDIASITARFGAMATMAGMSKDEVLAWATAATATGMKSEAAGGALMRVIGRIETATAGVSEGMRQMAEDSEDSAETLEAFEEAKGKLEAFAKVAGMSSEEFATKWQENSSEAFKSFIEGLARLKKEGASVEAVLQNDLEFGNQRDRILINGLVQEVSDGSTVIADSLKMAKDAFNGIDDEFGDAGDASREAERKSEGFSGAMGKLRNAVTALGVALGDGFMPLITAGTDALAGMAKAVGALPPEVKTAIAVIGGFAAAAGPMMVAVGAIGDGMLTFAKISGQVKSSGGFFKLFKDIRSDAAGAAIAIGDIGASSEKAAGKGARLKGALSGLGKGLAFGAAIIAVEKLGEAIYQAWDKAQKFEKSTTGLKDALNSIDGTASVTINTGDWTSSVDQIIEKQAEFADKVKATFTDVNSNAAMVDGLYNQIKELAGAYGESADAQARSAEEQAKLQTLVEMWNEATGDNLEIIDAQKGLLSESTDELKRNADAWIANAKAQAAQELYKEGYKKQLEIQQQMADLQEQINVKQQEQLAWQEAHPAGSRDFGLYELTQNLERLKAEYETLDAANARLSQTAVDEQMAFNNLNQTITDFETALVNVGRSADEFDAIAQRLSMTPDDLATALSNAQISAQHFASVTADQFADIYESADHDFGGVKAKLDELDRSTANPQVNVEDNSAEAAKNVNDNIAQIPNVVTKFIDIVQRFFGGTPDNGAYRATGGISPRTIDMSSRIPRNAAGGINGIITRAMLTNVGWVGEAGDEAIFHMRNAGGAIVPLSNRQHVKPFAQAVAAEMPYSGASDIVAELRALRNSLGEVNLNVTVQSNRWDDPDEIGRRIGNAAALELKMRGVVA